MCMCAYICEFVCVGGGHMQACMCTCVCAVQCAACGWMRYCIIEMYTIVLIMIVVQVQQEGNTAMAELQAKWIQLQTHVNCLIDSDLDKLSNDVNKLQGIKQVGCGACCCCSAC